MKSKKWTTLSLGVFLSAALLFTGCKTIVENKAPLSEKSFAIVVKSAGNQYFEVMIDGFCSVIEAQGGELMVRQPSSATAEEQIIIINELITENVDCIAVAANSETALGPALERAIDKGISVLSFDSSVSSESRALHVNQADASRIAWELMAAASDITGGEGQIAIMSTTNQANNQNIWIDEMRDILEAGTYPGLMLVDIVYGEDDYQKSYQKTKYLIQKYPELAVIIAPTAAGMPGVAEYITQQGLEQDIKITGLGMPSQMAEYIGDNMVCSYMFLWNPEDVGKLTAYAAIALVNKTISGEVGEILSAGDMGKYEIVQDQFSGSEIVLQEDPIRFDSRNIDYWKFKY